MSASLPLELYLNMLRLWRPHAACQWPRWRPAQRRANLPSLSCLQAVAQRPSSLFTRRSGSTLCLCGHHDALAAAQAARVWGPTWPRRQRPGGPGRGRAAAVSARTAFKLAQRPACERGE